MKKTLISALIISLIIQCLGGFTAFADVTMTGDGTVESPYLIGTLDDLIAFRDKVNSGETTACATLTSDIVAGQWTPIGTAENKYAGTFDGNGKTITGIKGAGSNTSVWGLFAYTNGGEIKNLTVSTGTDAAVSIGHQAALLVGIASNDTKITKCAGYGDVSGWGYIGGITYDGDCVVTDCYYVGNISGAHNITAMGLKAVATNCFAYGNITATTHAFRISQKSNTSNSYFLYSKGDAGTGGYGIEKNAEAFASGEVAYLLGESFGQTIGVDSHPVFRNESNAVYTNALGGYGNKDAEDGSIEKPYTIASASALGNFRNLVNNGNVSLNAKLGADIKLSGNWTPIGTSTNKYAGTFDGNGKTITGINGAGSNTSAWGLFAYTNGGGIKNLTVSTGTDAAVSIGHQAALLVGIASNDTKITKCAGYGNVSGWGYIGGITYDGDCVVTDCYYVGNISGAHNITAMGLKAVATNCFAYGNITATTHAFRISQKSNTSNSYFLYSKGEAGTGGHGVEKSTDAFANGEVAYLLGDAFGQTIGVDSHPVFKTDDNAVYFVDKISYTNDNTENGSAEKPYTIGSFAELKNFRTEVNGGKPAICAVLTKNIDVSSEFIWTPIGTKDNKYAGTFDGNGCEITGINSAAGITQWGLVSYANGGEIKNLTIKAGNNGTIMSGHQSALFVGVASNDTKITNCVGIGNISVNDGFVGGITSDGACIVTNCYYVGDVTGVVRASAMGYDAKAYNCFAYSNITATTNAFKISNGSAENCYYLASSGVSGTGGFGEQKSADAFANGEVAYLINKNAGDIIYDQSIGIDAYPTTENDSMVYKKLDGTYSNSEGTFVGLNNSEAVIISATDALAFIAQYEENGALIIANPITLKAGVISATEIIPADGATNAKIFVWDSLTSIRPIANVEGYTFQ